MDDYSLASLTESKNEWCARLVNLLTQHIITGIDSIFNEAVKLCEENEESNKYLMTFQNLLSAIPSWNPVTIQNEKKRIETESGCKYLEDLVTCVHIIQLKALTCVRVGEKQKKIDINIPSVDLFIHSIYINVARKLYTNIYLYEKDLYPLQIQKNKHEVEYLVKEAILITIRDNIPVERILHCYMEENEDVEIPKSVLQTDVKENMDIALENKNGLENKENLSDVPINLTEKPNLTDEKLSILANELKKDNSINVNDNQKLENNESNENIKLDINTENMESNSNPVIANKLESKDNLEKLISSFPVSRNEDKPSMEILKTNNEEIKKPSIEFSNQDSIITELNQETVVNAPKDLDTLNKIAEERKLNNDEDEDDEKLNIGDDTELKLDVLSL
tara:strand:+ start:270 stop:1448 length:1179 start_codon:yes stop_codon:yes gene_type:complete